MRKGFTLIELLVVIAIIAILAAILFPVFAQARERARMAACLSHGNQLGKATMMYVDDYNGRYPTYAPLGITLGTLDGKVFKSQRWSYRIHPGFREYVKDDKIWICPSKGSTGYYGKRYAFGYLQTWIPLCHDEEFAGFDTGWSRTLEDGVTQVPRTQSELDGLNEKSLSQRVAWYCCVLNWPRNTMPDNFELPYIPHRDGSIYVYMDGHTAFKQVGNGAVPADY